MATGGLYGNSGTGALIAQPGTETPGLYGKSPNGSVVAQPGSESAGLYGNGTTFGGSYFEWFVFQISATQPATPTGGSWSFQTDSGTPPSGWTNAPASNPTNPVWISIALVNSKSTSALVWSTPGVLSYSGTINGSGAPTSGVGQIGELYIQTGVTPNALWFKTNSTTWTQITGSALYVDLVSSQTIAGTKIFSSTIQGSISGNAETVTNGVYTNGTYVNPAWITSLAGSKITGDISGNAANVTGNVAIVNGGTGATTASGARTNLGLGTIATQNASSVAITGGSITGITDLAIADGGTGASTAGQARTNLGLGTAAVLDAGVANGVATLDSGGTVPLSQIPASLQGGVSYQGAWNASTNSPTLVSGVGTKGYYYVVSVAGSTNLNGVTDWNVGDWAIFNGTIWQKIDNTDAVTSVAGRTGAVVLTTSDIGGLGTIATQNANAVAITGGTESGVTHSGDTIGTYLDYTGTSAPSYVEGRSWYDSSKHALAYYNDSPNDVVHVGQDLIVKVINNTGSTIANGSPVYITSTSSGQSYPNIALAKADVAATSAVIGLTNGSIANGAIGYVTSQGGIDNVNTSTFTVGQVLYLSPYSAGQLMNTLPPTGITVQVGVVQYVNSSTGIIYVKQTTPLSVPASIITGTLPIANGGTGATTASGARTNLGLGTIATQDANNVAITGGTIDNTVIGGTTPAAGTFTTLTATGTGSFGTGSTDYVNLAGFLTRPFLYVAGSSTNISMLYRTKGSGAHSFNTADSGSNEQLRVSHTASAVNYVQVTGAATGGIPTVSAQGSDSFASIALSAKAGGDVRLTTAATTGWVRMLPNGTEVLRGVAVASNINYHQAQGSATGNGLQFSAQGSDTNISQVFQSKGTGAIDLAAGSSGVNISNGGTVTAVTVTANGGSYTSAPTWSATAPTTAGGVQATGTTVVGASAALTINGGGTGYTAGDLLTVVGGTNTQAAVITVGTVSAGVITAATVTTFGQYSVVPTNPVSVTGGTGSGATFTLTYFVRSCAIGNAGSGYVEQPTVSFSGGGGSGAAAYATVGSGTIVKSLGSTMSFYTPNGEALRIVDYPSSTTAGYWAVYAPNAAPQLRAFGTASGVIGTNSAVPLQFQTNAGVDQFRVAHTASAVNYVQVTGAATGGNPSIQTAGSDGNRGLSISSKGTSAVGIYSGAGTYLQFQVVGTNSAVNYLQAIGTTAGNSPSFAVAGSDTNIDLTLTPKGTGVVQFGSYTASPLLAVAGYITIKDSGGTTRRLLVG
jgi:hypothetical protein